MKIKEFSEKVGLSEHTVRYYEKEGLIQNIKRDKSGTRQFSEFDIRWVEFIQKMKRTQMPIKDIQVYANCFYNEEENVDERIEILQKHKKFIQSEIVKLQEADEYIDYKINYYQSFKEENVKKAVNHLT